MYFEPPRKEGNSPEYVSLYRWLCLLTEQLNVAMAELEAKGKEDKKQK